MADKLAEALEEVLLYEVSGLAKGAYLQGVPPSKHVAKAYEALSEHKGRPYPNPRPQHLNFRG